MKCWVEKESLRDREWSWRPKEREGREAQDLKRVARVREDGVAEHGDEVVEREG